MQGGSADDDDDLLSYQNPYGPTGPKLQGLIYGQKYEAAVFVMSPAPFKAPMAVPVLTPLRSNVVF